MPTHILMVDDDPNICRSTNIYLKKAGYSADFAEDGEKALSLFELNRYQLVILDLMLPKVDGWEVCRRIRKSSTVPIIMLTARGQIHERIEGLHLGADDYIVKPFDPNELLARMGAILRRAASEENFSKETLKLGSLELHLINHQASLLGESLKLPKKEFDILAYFLKHPNRVFSREALIENIWGWDFEGDERVIDLYIKRLRTKLSTKKDDFWEIKTVWKVGYQLEVRQ
jgi:DNA-binding response OmpR family regulator